MANLVLNTKTYVGRGVSNLIAQWANMAAGVLAGIAYVTGKVRLPSRKGEKVLIDWRMRLPVVTTEASACACPGEAIDEIDCYIQVRATQGVSQAVRTDFALQVKDLVATTDFQSSIINFTQPTG